MRLGPEPADYLSSGHAPGRGSAAGPMAEAVANSRSVFDERRCHVPRSLVRVVLIGADLKTAKGRGCMPSFGDAYSDAEPAPVANYAIHHFGGKSGTVTAQAVRERRTVR